MLELKHGFVCLHLGAGFHSTSKYSAYKKLSEEACNVGAKLLNEGRLAVDVATQMICFLENSELTNAGYGSNLTQDGSVECESAIMESKTGLFGAVGGVKHVKNPIKVARIVLEEQLDSLQILVPPVVLSGEAVDAKAQSNSIEVVENDALISPKSRKNFVEYSKILKIKNEDEGVHKKKRKINDDEGEFQDTIGVICIDKNADIASAISSGGLILKKPGRLGPSVQFGSGCWSMKYTNNLTVACCTSGTGEAILRTRLAQKAANFITKDIHNIFNMNDFIEGKFVNSKYLPDSLQQRLCGVMLIALTTDELGSHVELHFSHNTDSFCVAYLAPEQTKAMFILSRSDVEGCSRNNRVVCQGFNIPLSLKSQRTEKL